MSVVKGDFMDNKKLRKISKKELLELLLSQAKRIEELELELQVANDKLNSKEIMIAEVGSLAEASLKLNDIFEVAQRSVDQYMFNVQKKCQRLEEDTNKKCQEKEQEMEEQLAQVEQKLKELTDKKNKCISKNTDKVNTKKNGKDKIKKKNKKRKVKT